MAISRLRGRSASSTSPAGGNDGSWLCRQPTATEANLFTWAHDTSGRQNAWDIQVAAEAGGYWDSDYGQNFRARFEPRTTCN